MAAKIVQFKDKDGNIVNFEVYEPVDDSYTSGMTMAGGSVTEVAKNLIEGAKVSLEEGFKPLKTTIQYIYDQINEMDPSEVEVSFGLKVSSEVGIVIGKADAEASIGVKMKWAPKKEEKKEKKDD